jgi:hypothetical protein
MKTRNKVLDDRGGLLIECRIGGAQKVQIVMERRVDQNKLMTCDLNRLERWLI